MSCSCIKTAILKENENEKLRMQIDTLKKQPSWYEAELYNIYSHTSSSSSSTSSARSSISHTNNSERLDMLYM
jgi:hypothetical protein